MLSNFLRPQFMIFRNKLERLSRARLCPMFEGKTGSNPSKSTSRCTHLRLAPGLANKHKTRLKKIVWNKDSILLWKFVNYRLKQFNNIGPRLSFKNHHNNFLLYSLDSCALLTKRLSLFKANHGQLRHPHKSSFLTSQIEIPLTQLFKQPTVVRAGISQKFLGSSENHS